MRSDKIFVHIGKRSGGINRNRTFIQESAVHVRKPEDDNKLSCLYNVTKLKQTVSEGPVRRRCILNLQI